MSFKKCINDGVSEGLIKQDQADEVFELFDDLETQYKLQALKHQLTLLLQSKN